ncbi:hypothetical protein ABGB18_38790 [Nonomuraea sp. B12E4]|uniref:hypothetical protein n=1 Tax=Nonomuraea sp. B12E4 TaxID=3153564 RepID=UPI00325E0C58
MVVGGLSPAAASTSETSADKPNLRACYDGKCKITITKSVSFPVHPRFHMKRLRVGFSSNGVTANSSSGGGAGASSWSGGYVSKGGWMQINGIRVTVVSLSDSKAVLSLTAKR